MSSGQQKKKKGSTPKSGKKNGTVKKKSLKRSGFVPGIGKKNGQKGIFDDAIAARERSFQQKAKQRAVNRLAKESKTAITNWHPSPPVEDEKPITRYGAKPAMANTGQSGDANVEYEVQPDNSLVHHLAGVVVCACINKIGAKADSMNAHFAARYLAYWWDAKWSGIVPTYDLKSAPAVVYDLMQAGLPKRKGNVIAHFLSSNAAPVVYTTANFGFPLGIGAGTGVGPITLDTAWTGWTPLAGYTAIRDIFDACSAALDVVDADEYKSEIADDDFSFYSCVSAFQQGNYAQYLFKAGGSNYPQGATIHNRMKITCQWLARVSCNAGSSAISGKYVTRRFCPPGTIIFMRMQKRWRGYQEHKLDCRLVYLDVTAHGIVMGRLLQGAIDILGSNPFTTAGTTITINEFKVIVVQLLQRWCHEWACASSGAYITYNGAVSRTEGMGVGHHVFFASDSLKQPQVLCESLSRVYPYIRQQTMFFPVMWIRDNTASFDVTLNAAGSWFDTVWDWATNLITGSNEVFINNFDLTRMTSIAAQWNKAMYKLAPYVPMGLQLEESEINAAEHHAVLNTNASNTGALWAVIKHVKTPDHYRSAIEQTLLPCVFISNTNQADLNWAASAYLKDYLASGNYGYMIFVEMFWSAIEGTIHISGGFGDEDGIVHYQDLDHSERGLVERRVEKEKEKKEKGASDMVVEFIKEQGVNVLLEALKAAV